MSTVLQTDELAALREDLATMREDHRAEEARLEMEIAELEAQRAHAAAGTSEEERRLARELIEVRINEHLPFEQICDERVIQEAVEDIAGNCLTLRSEYFARRHYEANTHRETFRYGMGPRHGNVVFSIGLTEGARAFLHRWGRLPLGVDGDVQEAAVRYLLGLREAGTL